MTKAQRISRWKAQKLYYSIGKQYQRKWTVKRGEVYFVGLGENVGSEENKHIIMKRNWHLSVMAGANFMFVGVGGGTTKLTTFKPSLHFENLLHWCRK